MIRNTFLSLIINEFNEFYHIFGVKYNGLNKTTKKIAFFFAAQAANLVSSCKGILSEISFFHHSIHQTFKWWCLYEGSGENEQKRYNLDRAKDQREKKKQRDMEPIQKNWNINFWAHDYLNLSFCLCPTHSSSKFFLLLCLAENLLAMAFIYS